MKRLFKSRPRVATALVTALALLLYLVGLKFLLVPVLLACMVMYLPFPRLFRSVLSRVVVSGFLLYGLLLIAMLIQWAVLPESGFTVAAVLVSILTVAVVGATARFRIRAPLPLIDRTDLAAGLVVLCFALPFVVAGGVFERSIMGVARYGAVQSTDGSNHFLILSEVAEVQHLEYKGGPFYPKGFHLDTAFVLDSLSLNPVRSGWGANARIYIMQFLIVGAAAAYALFYAGRLLADMVSKGAQRLSSMWLACTIGVPLALLYLLPFAYEGFINYTYAVAAFVLALVYLHTAIYGEGAADPAKRRLYLVGYLLLVLGVSMSWTLLMPPLVLIPLLMLAPQAPSRQAVVRALRAAFRRENAVVWAAFLLQLSPIVLQLSYASSAASNTDFFSAPGSIRTFHFGLAIAGLALVVFVALYKGFTAELRSFIVNIFVPLYLFLLILVFAQYFQIGELRYYAIKSAYLGELVLVLLAAALLLRAFASAKLGWLQSRALPVGLLMCGCLLLIGLSGNPLKAVRETFRGVSGFGYPTFYEEDVHGVVGIYKDGRGRGDNVAVVHYDTNSGNISGNMMVPNWAGALAFKDRTHMGRWCAGRIYAAAMYMPAGKEQQDFYKDRVLACAGMAREHGQEFYVVTDPASAPYLRDMFGNQVKLVY
jgi:hypothetical protein